MAHACVRLCVATEDLSKFLEKMPPVEVFVGLDAVRSSAEAVPGLPSKEELEQWLVEHDKIEKETEIFDSGELSKLKKLTRGACHVLYTYFVRLRRTTQPPHSGTCPPKIPIS